MHGNKGSTGFLSAICINVIPHNLQSASVGGRLHILSVNKKSDVVSLKEVSSGCVCWQCYIRRALYNIWCYDYSHTVFGSSTNKAIQSQSILNNDFCVQIISVYSRCPNSMRKSDCEQQIISKFLKM